MASKKSIAMALQTHHTFLLWINNVIVGYVNNVVGALLCPLLG